jgi:hypothetical protein
MKRPEWLDELNPVKNWRGWLVCLFILAALAVMGRFDGPKQAAEHRQAAENIRTEARK